MSLACKLVHSYMTLGDPRLFLRGLLMSVVYYPVMLPLAKVWVPRLNSNLVSCRSQCQEQLQIVIPANHTFHVSLNETFIETLEKWLMESALWTPRLRSAIMNIHLLLLIRTSQEVLELACTLFLSHIVAGLRISQKLPVVECEVPVGKSAKWWLVP